MIEIRWHGRGGQGAVTAARLLAEAAFREGKYVQAFPFFGAERRGAPVVAFTRISDSPIRIHSQVYDPDIVVVLDPTLPKMVDVAAGLKLGGTVILNLKEPLPIPHAEIFYVDASAIALETLKVPITNTAMLGAVARATNLVRLESVCEAVRSYFPEKLADKNIQAIRVAYEKTVPAT
jgi:2-oxoacid:acceptor oxidoreductase gamma subunit (pyruvate/2-ketoisovalerate family)